MKNLIFLIVFLFSQISLASFWVPDGSITKPKLAAANVVESTGMTTAVENSGIPAPIAGLSASITTTGRPVLIKVNSNSTGVPGGGAYCRSTVAKTAISCNFYIYKNSNPLQVFYLGSSGASGTLNTSMPSSVISFIDTNAAAGSNTYTIYMSSTVDTVGIQYSKLMLMEL